MKRMCLRAAAMAAATAGMAASGAANDAPKLTYTTATADTIRIDLSISISSNRYKAHIPTAET
jgi:hypothetical protein